MQVSEASAELLLGASEPPTAIICMTDLMAVGVINMAGKRGLALPRDLSIVGFDDHPLAGRSKPALTTARQPAEARGRAAIQAIMAAIDSSRQEKKGRVKHILQATALIVRESTAAPSTS